MTSREVLSGSDPVSYTYLILDYFTHVNESAINRLF